MNVTLNTSYGQPLYSINSEATCANGILTVPATALGMHC